MDIKTVPVAKSEQETVAQIAAAAPGKGWFCYESRYDGKPVSSSCQRTVAKCQQNLADMSGAFGSIAGTTYSACEPSAGVHCFVLRAHGDFVPPDIQVQCAKGLTECMATRAIFAKKPEAEMEVGTVCVAAD